MSNAKAKASPSPLAQLFKPLASLRLTVVLLILAGLLIFFGTWAQRFDDIWFVQKKYFHSFFAWVNLGIIHPKLSFIGFPMPGGYTLILLTLANLLAAHAMRFKVVWGDLILLPLLGAMIFFPQLLLDRLPTSWNSYTWGGIPVAVALAFLPLLGAFSGVVAALHGKRTGVILIHLALILLLAGEGVTSLFAVESRMTIDEGETVNFSYDIREPELAVIDAKSAADQDKVVAFSKSMLNEGATLQAAGVPFKIKIDTYYQNSTLLGPFQAQQRGQTNRATAGELANRVVAVPVNKNAGVGSDAAQADMPSAYATLSAGDKPLGTYVLSAGLSAPQTVEVDGKAYQIALRFRRHYHPFALHLKKFSFDRYPGTTEARNYSALVQLVDPTRNENREVLIWMNHPLRYAGLTMFQSSFDPSTERTTHLQVVRNPGVSMPYIACAMGGLGLLIHFGINLFAFIRRSWSGSATPITAGGTARPSTAGASYTLRPRRSGADWWFPAVVTSIFAIYLVSLIREPANKTQYDLNSFGQIPVSFNGRVQPLDSIAQNTLKTLSGKSVLRVDVQNPSAVQKMLGLTTTKKPAVQWLIDVWAGPNGGEDYKVFRIDDAGVKNLIAPESGKQEFLDRRMFSISEIMAHREKLDAQFKLIPQKASERDAFQRQLSELGNQLETYFKLEHFASLLLVPPIEKNGPWRELGEVVQEGQTSGSMDSFADGMRSILQAYHGQQPAEFNSATGGYLAMLRQSMLATAEKAEHETVFHRVDPFMQLAVLYVIVFVLVVLSWMVWSRPLYRAAWCLLVLTIAFHAISLAARIYLSGRPPVTNLYSAAIFIPFGAAVLSLGMEWFFRYGIGLAIAGTIGFISLVVALNLNTGDNMAVLQAVLDTNFWLATHVVIITLGYAATYLAGFLAIFYIIGGVFTPALRRDTGDVAKVLTRMVYGTLCFAILFSFVGTVLGGIWADQSWGRFWGWDPKENGAALIVLWNAVVLHARWGGMARERGVMTMAVFGNIVTTWSFFGTNMLGIGLHAYGFMDAAFLWLVAFVTLMLALIAVGLMPLNWWRSFAPAPAGKLESSAKAAPVMA